MREFLDFLAASPSAFHAAASVRDTLVSAGFMEQDPRGEWDVSPGGHVLTAGGAVLAWWIPDRRPRGFRIIGSHTDSPGFKLKTGTLDSHGWQQAPVEVYGGPILSSWFDRELAFAGQVVLSDGATRLVHTGPIARIASLAIHLDRQPGPVDKQLHMQPLIGVDGPDVVTAIAESLGVAPQDIASHDLITIDTQPPRVFGADGNLLAAGRLDNLSSVYPSLVALLTAERGDDVQVLAAFNHEEVGSASAYGAAGPLLEQVLRRTCTALGRDWWQMAAESSIVSADAAHSVHPNYAGHHDPTHQPLLGRGPVIKINANQRYASSATSVAVWRHACESADVPCQEFVSHNSMPTGSTIGPLTATRLGIDTVDVGIPLLSMHSARELAGVSDVQWFARALEAYLSIDDLGPLR